MLYAELAQVAEIHPHARGGPAYSIVSIMAAEGSVTQGARASTAMALTYR